MRSVRGNGKNEEENVRKRRCDFVHEQVGALKCVENVVEKSLCYV